MALFGYLFCWMMAHIAAVVVGTAAHYAHAHLSLPEKLIDGHRWRDHMLNGALNDDYNMWADYDEMGFWKFDSLKNWLMHVLPLSFLVLLVGVWLIGEHEAVVEHVCTTAGGIGVVPLFCS